jgi:hypothetical protein
MGVKPGLTLRENTDRGCYKTFGLKRDEKQKVLYNFLRKQS